MPELCHRTHTHTRAHSRTHPHTVKPSHIQNAAELAVATSLRLPVCVAGRPRGAAGHGAMPMAPASTRWRHRRVAHRRLRGWLGSALLLTLAALGMLAPCCHPADVDVALQVKPNPDTGASSVGFKVQQLPAFTFVSARGDLELGSGNTTLLHISGPSSAGNKTLAAAAARRKSYSTDGKGSLQPGGEVADVFARAGDRNIAGAKQIAKDISLPGTLDVTGAFAIAPSGLLQVFGRPQWKMAVHEDFTVGTVTGWTNTGTQRPMPINNGISICSERPRPDSDFFLGAYKDVETKKTFVLPVHTRARLRMRVHYIDKWEGESFFVKVDGEYVYTRGHSWCPSDKVLVEPCLAKQSPTDQRLGINVCGDPNYPDTLSTLVDIQVAHTSHKLQVTVGAKLGRNTAASWGIDDFSIFVQ